MKRVITAAMALLMCSTSVLAQTPEELRQQRREARQEAKEQKQQQPAKPQQPAQPQQPRRQQPAAQQPNAVPQPRRQQPVVANPYAPPRPDRADRPARPDRDERRDRRQDATPVGPADVPRPDRPRPDRPRADRPDRPDRADRPDRPRPDRPDAPRPDRPRADRPDRPRADRPDRPRANLPTKPNRPRADRQRDQRFDQARSREKRQQARQARQTDRRGSWNRRAGGRMRKVVRAQRYNWPAGYRYRAWRRGDRFPLALALSTWFLSDWLTYGLYAPSYSYRWVRYGPDAVLIGPSGEIQDIRYGVFYDGSVDDYGSDGPAIDPSLPQDFLTGELSLQGYGRQCDDFYGDDQLQDEIDAAWADEDWNGLARMVVDGDCDSDLSYYLLGLAAEGLALNEASASFYQRALDLYDEQYQDNCDAFDACRDMRIGDEAAAGLERIYGRES